MVTITDGEIAVGLPEIVLMADSCHIGDFTSCYTLVRFLQEHGVRLLRVGIYQFRCLQDQSSLSDREWEVLIEVREATGIALIVEVVDPRDLPRVAGLVDMVEIGSAQMSNQPLLREAGSCQLPVLLRRGQAATCQELLASATSLSKAGNDRVILCEQGIRTFESGIGTTLDLSAVPVLKELDHYPVVVDPGQGAGRYQLVGALGRAAVAAGADGLLLPIESCVHTDVTGNQVLSQQQFLCLLPELKQVARAVGRVIRDGQSQYKGTRLMQVSQGVANDDY